MLWGESWRRHGKQLFAMRHFGSYSRPEWDFSQRYECGGIDGFMGTSASSGGTKLPWRCGEQAPSKRNLYTNTGSVISRNLQLFRNEVRRFSTKSAILRAPHCFLFCHLPLLSIRTASKKYRPLERKKIVVRCSSVPKITRYLTVCAVYHVVRRNYTALICTASHLEEHRPYELM